MSLHDAPEIPECHVSVDDDGTIRLRHKVSGDPAVATTEREAVELGMLLRVAAVYQRELLFTADDMP
ncbi:hypothetical protein [Nonomuraea lactucae]|uniref:hypothetical protein n=1 Tax=Nonomuraea lactucae TaxID=2249762 RepID=UPI0013B3707E|nr:hypothetical protein [Nonomuraea lactucae]